MALSRPIRAGPEASAAASLRQHKALVDELWEVIFLRFASPPDLARAAAACVSFRRIITHPSFLRRYRSLHPPLFLGIILKKDFFRPVSSPHPNARAATALARAAAGFTTYHLPRGRGDWSPCDVRDGRVLLQRCPGGEAGNLFPDLTVYDPLSRRYLLLPRIPHHLLSSVGSINRWVSPSLLPASGREEEDNNTSFRVISMRYCEKKLAVFIFSSGSGCWSFGNSTTSDALNLIVPHDDRIPPEYLSGDYAYGCLYWKAFCKNKLLKFNVTSLEFFTVDYPPAVHDPRDHVVAEVAEARLGMFSLANTGRSLYYNTRENGELGSNEWKTEDMITLPCGYSFFIVGALAGYIILFGHPEIYGTHSGYFSLEVKTLEIQMISMTSMLNLDQVYPYIVGFPPSI